MLTHSPSYSFFILNGASFVLCYSKVEGELFFFTWTMALAPTFLFLFISCLKYLKNIVLIDDTVYKECYTLKTNHFQLIDNFFHLNFNLLALFFSGYLAHQLDMEDTEMNKKPLYLSVALYLFMQFSYSYVSRSIEQESYLPFSAKNKDTSMMTSIMSPIFNFLGSSFMLCSGGSCSSIYGSTISAIFSAFGISISEWLPFLDWFTLLLVIVSVLVLYYAKRSLTYKPFLVSVVGAVVIFADTLMFQMRYPIYLGNLLMIASALWNSRLNKAGFFFPGKPKKAVPS